MWQQDSTDARQCSLATSSLLPSTAVVGLSCCAALSSSSTTATPRCQHPHMSDATALTKALLPWVTVDVISMEPVFLHPATHVGVHVLLWSSLLLTFGHIMLQALEPFRWAANLSARNCVYLLGALWEEKVPQVVLKQREVRSREQCCPAAQQEHSRDITFQGQLGFACFWRMQQLLASLSRLPAFNICSSWNSRDQAAKGVGFTDPKVTRNPVPWTKKVLPLRTVVYVGLGLSGLA